jgi:hypothetical protein
MPGFSKAAIGRRMQKKGMPPQFGKKKKKGVPPQFAGAAKPNPFAKGMMK